MTLFALSIDSLERLCGGLLPKPSHTEPKRQDVAARLRRLVVTAPTSVGAPAPEKALTELLRGRGAQRVWISRHTVQPWCLLPLEVPIFLDGEHELMRRTREETRALVEDGGAVKPYIDSTLRHNKKRNQTCRRQLWCRSMLNFVDLAKARAGVFFCRDVIHDKVTIHRQRSTGKLCSSKSLLGPDCVLLRHVPKSKLNGTISRLLTKKRFLLAFQGSVWRWVRQRCRFASTA